MRRFVLVVTAFPVFAARARAQQTPLSDSVARAIDGVFANWQSTNGPGCALGVSRDGRSILERGYGMANLETDTPMRPTSIFHVASVSKQFTAMAIMLLERDGKLSVNDDIRKYIPEIPDYGTPITIRHLLTHTSGLRDQWSLIALERGRFEEDRITEADVMDVVTRQTALNFKPGAEYLYSNTGFTLLGVIVRRVSGQSLKDFAAARIFTPLGMTHTHFHDDYTMLVPGRTSAYEPTKSGWRVGIPNFDVYGATSLYTTVGDLLKWETELDAPSRVADGRILARMEAPTILTNGDTSTYGFGLIAATYRDARVVEHNGADAGYRSYVGRFPQQHVAIAVLCNGATANTTALARGVADVVLAESLAPRGVATASTGIRLPDSALQKLAGLFVQPTTMQVLELTVRGGALHVGSSPALVTMAPDRVRAPGGPEIVFTAANDAIDIHPPAGGRAIRYERRAPATATRSLLAQYAGRYVSDELAGAVYTVAASDSTIALRTGTSEPMQARLVFDDTFVSGGYTIQFSRSGGKVTGFDVTDGRMRHVKFVRR